MDIICSMTDPELIRLLRELQDETIAKALIGQSETVKSRIFTICSADMQAILESRILSLLKTGRTDNRSAVATIELAIAELCAAESIDLSSPIIDQQRALQDGIDMLGPIAHLTRAQILEFVRNIDKFSFTVGLRYSSEASSNLILSAFDHETINFIRSDMETLGDQREKRLESVKTAIAQALGRLENTAQG